MLSYNYWRTHLGSARDVIGQTILINGHSFTIIGVAPPNFDSAIGGYRPSVFVPTSMVDFAIPWRAPLDDLNNHHSTWLTLVARLKPGVTRQQAEASMRPLWHSLRAEEFASSKSRSERFRKNFLDLSTIRVLDDSKGFNPNRIDLQKPLVILMSMAWPARGSLRHQCCDPAAVAGRQSRSRNVDALRTRRAPQPHLLAIDDRGRCPWPDRRHRRNPSGARGRNRPGAHSHQLRSRN